MRRFGLIFVSLVPLLFLTGCDLKTTMDYDRDVDFSTIETYKWVGRDHPEISDLEYKKIVSAVDTQLELKGFQKVDSDPDVVVTYFGDNNERTVVDTTHYGYGYGGGWYWGHGYGGGMSTSTSQVRTYTEGTLVLDMYLASKKELIWRGTVTGTVVDDPQKMEKKVNKGLAKLFKEYPPAQK